MKTRVSLSSPPPAPPTSLPTTTTICSCKRLLLGRWLRITAACQMHHGIHLRTPAQNEAYCLASHLWHSSIDTFDTRCVPFKISWNNKVSRGRAKGVGTQCYTHHTGWKVSALISASVSAISPLVSLSIGLEGISVVSHITKTSTHAWPFPHCHLCCGPSMKTAYLPLSPSGNADNGVITGPRSCCPPLWRGAVLVKQWLPSVADRGKRTQCLDGRRGQTQTSADCLAGKTQTIKMQRIENKLQMIWVANGDETQCFAATIWRLVRHRRL